MKSCHHCGTAWPEDKRQPGPHDCCNSCSAFLHACLNCRFHDRAAHNQCNIPNTDWVADRRGGNFCDQFEFKDTQAKVAGGAETAAREAAARLLDDSGEDAQRASALESFLGIHEARKKPPKSLEDLFPE